MRLNDESVMMLTDRLYTLQNIKKIDLRNNNIHYKGLKYLLSRFPIEKVYFDECKELLVDDQLPQIIKNIQKNHTYKKCRLIFNDNLIDDVFLQSFISLRLNELGEIEYLDLSSISFIFYII